MNKEKVVDIWDMPAILQQKEGVLRALAEVDAAIRAANAKGGSFMTSGTGSAEQRKNTEDMVRLQKDLADASLKLQGALKAQAEAEATLARERAKSIEQARNKKEKTDEEIRASIIAREEMKRRTDAIKAEGDAYKQLSLEYQKAQAEAKKLQAAAAKSGGAGDAKSAEAAVIKAKDLYDKLSLIDTRVGDFHRRVGDYNSVWEGWSKVGKGAIDKIDHGFKEMWGNIKTMAASFIGLTGIFEFGKSALETFEHVEMQTTRLENALHNLGASREDVKKLDESLEGLSKQFAYLSKTDLRDVQQRLVQYGKLTAEQIGELMPTIVNFAANARIGVTEATDVITKALEGQARGLKTYGINIKEAKTEAERFALIQTQLADRVDGAGKVFGESGAGKVEEYKRKMGELKVQIGSQLMPIYQAFLEKSISIIKVIKEIDLSNVIKGVAALGATWVAYRTYVLAAAIAQEIKNGTTAREILLDKEASIITKAVIVLKQLFTRVTRLATIEIELFNGAVKTSPLGILITLLGAGIALFGALRSSASGAADAIHRHNLELETTKDVMTKGNGVFSEQKKVIDELVAKVNNHNLALDTRKKALSELKSLDDAYLNSLTLENVATKEGTDLLDNYVKALNKKAIEEAAIDEKKGLAKQRIDRELKMNKDTSSVQEKIDASADAEKRIEKLDGGIIAHRQKVHVRAIKDAAEENSKEIKASFVKDMKDLESQEKTLDEIIKRNESKAQFNQKSGVGSYGGKDNKKTDKFDDTSERLRAEQEILKAKGELRQLDIEEQKKYLGQIVADERNSISLRMESERFLADMQKEEAKNNGVREVADIQLKLNRISDIERKGIGERTNEEKKLLIDKEALLLQREVAEKKAATKIAEINADLSLKLKSMFEKEGNKVFDGFIKDVERLNSESLTEVLNEDAAAFSKMDKQLRDGKISLEEYNKQHKELSDKAALRGLDEEESGIRRLIEARQLYGLSTKDLEQKLLELHIKQEKIKTAASINSLKDREAAEKKLHDLQKQAGTEGLSLGKQLIDGVYTRRINKIQELIDANTKWKDAEITRINASTLSEQDKAARIVQINAQAQAKQDELDKKKRDQQLKQAKFDRDTQVLKIIGETLYQASKEGWITPAAIAIEVIGALQVTSLLAKPLPKFASGTDSAPGGPALTDERGPELYIEPSGSMFFGNDRPTIRNVEKGTQIIPHDQVNEWLHRYMLIGMSDKLSTTRVDTSTVTAINSMRDLLAVKLDQMAKGQSKQRSRTIVNTKVDLGWGEYLRRNVYD